MVVLGSVFPFFRGRIRSDRFWADTKTIPDRVSVHTTRTVILAAREFCNGATELPIFIVESDISDSCSQCECSLWENSLNLGYKIAGVRFPLRRSRIENLDTTAQKCKESTPSYTRRSKTPKTAYCHVGKTANFVISSNEEKLVTGSPREPQESLLAGYYPIVQAAIKRSMHLIWLHFKNMMMENTMRDRRWKPIVN